MHSWSPKRRVAVLAVGWLAIAADSPEGAELRPRVPREDRLEGGRGHVHVAELAPGAWRIAVDELGVDVELEARDPAGRVLGRSAGPLVDRGTEILVLDVTEPGRHVFTVGGRDPDAAGRYRIELRALAADDERGRLRLEAERAFSRGGMASARGTPAARREAIAHYRESLATWRRLGETEGEARALHAIARLRLALEERRPAIEELTAAAGLWRRLGEAAREATALGAAAQAHYELGESARAAALYERTLALYRRAGEPTREAMTRSNLCEMERARGELEAARACFDAVLPTLVGGVPRRHRATVLNNLGGVHYQLGEPVEARHRLTEALELRRDLEDDEGESEILNNLASLERYLGNWQTAIALYGRALSLARASDDRRRQAVVLNNLGYAYRTLGELDRAHLHFEQALALRREIGDRRGQAVTLNNLATVYLRWGQPVRAASLRRKVLALYGEIGDRRGEIHARIWLGRDLLAAGEVAAALDEVDAALALAETVDDLRNRATALADRGEVLAALGQLHAARASLDAALELQRRQRRRAGELKSLVALAEVERRLGSPTAALDRALAAIEVLESLRADAGSPELRATFVDARPRAYELAVALHMDLHRLDPTAGHARAAIEVSERARGRGLLDLLGESEIDPQRGVDPELRRRRRELDERLRFLTARRERAREPSAIEKAVEETLSAIDGVEAEIRLAHPRYVELVRPRPLDVEGMQRHLDADTALLHFALGEERSFAWYVTKSSVEAFELAARPAVEAAARRLHQELATLTVGDAGDGDAARALSEMLLGPIASAGSQRRLAIIADGALHYVPFAALPLPGDSGEPLLARHEVVHLPSASILALLRRKPARRARHTLAVVADPIFDPRDSRSDGIGGGESTSRTSSRPSAAVFDRLPASRLEAEGIAALVPPDEALLALDGAADREAILGGALAFYRYVHFATHGVVDDEHPRLSGLRLSTVDGGGQARDGFLSLGDVYELELDAELVVLSGCRTALGRELRGEGLVGLTYGFFYAGAPRVVASLWRVEDRATARLMERFYRALIVDGRTPAAALREAQLETRAEARTRDPYYWAAFTLQGDWR